MSAEATLCSAVAQAILADESSWGFLGKSLSLHAQVADNVDAAIVRGGQGRCLVRLSPSPGSVDAGFDGSARETVLVELEVEANAVGGLSAVRRGEIAAAVRKTFGPPGTGVLALAHAMQNTGLAAGRAGAIVGVDMNFEAGGDARNPKAIVTIQFGVWTAR